MFVFFMRKVCELFGLKKDRYLYFFAEKSRQLSGFCMKTGNCLL